MARKTPHNHQDPSTSVLRECMDQNCKLPFKSPFAITRQDIQRARKRNREDAMYRYAKLVYESDRL
jgi:hypothetical protein